MGEDADADVDVDVTKEELMKECITALVAMIEIWMSDLWSVPSVLSMAVAVRKISQLIVIVPSSQLRTPSLVRVRHPHRPSLVDRPERH